MDLQMGTMSAIHRGRQPLKLTGNARTVDVLRSAETPELVPIMRDIVPDAVS
jgi:hypothetical protein